MRCTIDIDTENKLTWAIALIKGIYFCRKLPKKIRKCSKGIHLIWSGLPITERQSFILRKAIGDDEKRIKLDLSSNKRINQVLFTEKTTTCFGFIHPYWTDARKRLYNCPKCGKKVEKSKKVWSANFKGVLVYHKETKNLCVLPLPK